MFKRLSTWFMDVPEGVQGHNILLYDPIFIKTSQNVILSQCRWIMPFLLIDGVAGLMGIWAPISIYVKYDKLYS